MRKQTIQHVLRIIVFGIFLAILSRLIKWPLFKEALSQISPGLLLLATLSYFVTIAIRAYRFQIILNTRERHISIKDAYVITLIGFALNLFIPATLGDIARSYYGYKIYGIKEEMLSTSFVDKMFALCSLFLIGTISGFVLGYGVLGGFSLLCATLTFIPLVFPGLIPWGLLNRLPAYFRKSLDKEKLLDAFHLPAARKIVVMGLSFAVWISASLFFYLVCAAFPVEVGLSYIVLIMPVMTIARLFPFTINALGPPEVAVAYFFHPIGINSTLAVTISLLANLLSSVIPGMLGFLLILFSRKK
ncbi:MAG: flippase-like domain-containing protein [bacterium]|nr:flippase-like domain-containing protein [bacterium]